MDVAMRPLGWALVLWCLLVGPVWAQPGSRAAVVVTAEAALRAIAPGRWVSAQVVAVDEARLAPERGGRLHWVAREGMGVAAGEPLARLDDRDERLQRDALQAEVERWRTQVRYLQGEERRLARLAKENSAAQTQWDEVRNELAQARAQQRVAEVRLREAELALERRRLVAPFPGVVAERLRRPGEWVGAGEAVVRLVGREALELQAAVPLIAAAYLDVGQRLPARVAGRSVEARLRAVAPVADPRSRQVSVWAVVEAGIPGAPARLWVPLERPQQRLAVPRDALVLRGGGAAVFKVVEETVERIPVRLGPAEGEWIAVEGPGLSAGDAVVIRGAERLRPGQKVKVREVTAP